MKIKKKLLASVLLALTLGVNCSMMKASAYSTSSAGSASGLTVNGTGFTVVVANCVGAFDGGVFKIDSFGNGNGTIDVNVYCSGGSVNKTKEFKKAEEWPLGLSGSGSWAVDMKNHSLTKTRTNVNVSWDLDC